MVGRLEDLIQRFLTFRRTWAALLLLLATGIVAWRFGPGLWALLRDEAALEAFLARLGAWGPLALIAANALQIVVAPVPGYPMQIVAGFLYGPWWGTLWGCLGMLLGGLLAMLLTRLYGRPLAERLVGAQRLAHWEGVAHSQSALVWGLLLLAPVGDLPYFLAGLARVGLAKMLILAFITRAPTVFVVVAAGAGIMVLPWWQLALILLGLWLALWLLARHHGRLAGWVERRAGRRVL